MGFLDGFEMVSYRPATRPPKGRMRITVAAGQVTFSKELAKAIGAPRFVQILQDKENNQIALRACRSNSPSAVSFVSEKAKKAKKEGKVIWKNPGLLETFHGCVEQLKCGIYYCAEAEIKEGVAIIDFTKATRYEVDEVTLEKLLNAKRRKAADATDAENVAATKEQ